MPASSWIARPWPIGWATARPSCRPWPTASRGTSRPDRRCTPTTRRCRCSTPDASRPRRDDYGCWSGTSGHGAVRHRRPSPISIHRIALRGLLAASPPEIGSRASWPLIGEHAQALLAGCSGFLHADGYAGFDRLYEPAELASLTEVGCPPRSADGVPSRDRSEGRLAIDGRMPGASSTTSTPRPTRRSPGRRWSGSASSSRSRPRSTAMRRHAASPPATRNRCRNSTRSEPFSSNPSPRSARRAASPAPSATASPAGPHFAATPPTAASR